MELFLALNLSDKEESKTFTDYNEEILREYNQNGFNVYKSINSFHSGKREINCLEDFLGIWIDLDYPVWKKEQRHEVILRIKKTLWVLPCKINDTYKWYHLFFNLSSSLKRLSFNSYKECYHLINTLLQGDPKMKDITWILKVEWFYDKKVWREDYLITTVYDEKKNELNKEFFENLWIKLEYQDIEKVEKEKEKREKKEMKKMRNEKDIEKIDALEFITMINELAKEREEWFDDYIELVKTWDHYSIWGTWGLKVLKNWTKYEIKDFADKSRYWLKWFFFNWYLKDENDVTKKLLLFMKLLKKLNTWIVLGYWADKLSYSKMWTLEIVNNIAQREKNRLPLFENQDLNEINDIIKSKLWWINWWQMMKVVTWLLVYATKNKKTLDEIIISEKELMEILWLSISKYNKSILRWILLEMWDLVYSEWESNVVLNSETELFTWIHLQHYFDISLYSWNKTWKLFYVIKSRQPKRGGVTYLSEWILHLDKGLADTRKTELAVKLCVDIKSFKTTSLTLDEFKDALWLSFKDEIQLRAKVVEFLKKLQSEKLIIWFEKKTSQRFEIW